MKKGGERRLNDDMQAAGMAEATRLTIEPAPEVADRIARSRRARSPLPYCLTRFRPRVKALTLDTSTSVGQIPAGEPSAMIPALRCA